VSAPTLDPSACGERIELLLEASAAAGPVARERAEELVRLVVELYGTGLERVLELAHEAGALDDDLLGALAADELVSSLLLVHGLHPYGVEERVERALDGVRPLPRLTRRRRAAAGGGRRGGRAPAAARQL